MSLNNSKNYCEMNKKLNTKLLELVKPLDFIKNISSPFFEDNINKTGFNHLFVIKNSDNKKVEMLPSIDGNIYKYIKSLKKGEKIYYVPACATGKKINALNNLVVTIYYGNSEINFMKLINATQNNSIARPTYTILEKDKKMVHFVYNFVTPLLYFKNRTIIFNAITTLVNSLMSLFDNLYFGGKCTEFRTTETEYVYVDTEPYYISEFVKDGEKFEYNDFVKCENTKKEEQVLNETIKRFFKKNKVKMESNIYTPIDILGANIYETGASFIDIVDLFNAIKNSYKGRFLSKKALKAIDELTYIANEQNRIYHKTSKEEITDKLGLQCDNILKRAKLASENTFKKPYDLLIIYAVSLIKAKRDEFYYKESLLEMFKVINSKTNDSIKITEEELDDLINLTNIEKETLASNYNFKANKDMLVENGHNVYKDNFRALRTDKYAESVISNMKLEETEENKEHYKEVFRHKGRKINTMYDSKVAYKILMHLIETENHNCFSYRGIAKNVGCNKETVEIYAPELKEFFIKNNWHKDNKEKLRKSATKNYLKAQEERRRRSLKARVFEIEFNLNLETLRNIAKLDKKLTKNLDVVELRKKGNYKIFNFIKLGFTVVYNYIADMCQVFKLHQEVLY